MCEMVVEVKMRKNQEWSTATMKRKRRHSKFGVWTLVMTSEAVKKEQRAE
jgi:hypothetical protein